MNGSDGMSYLDALPGRTRGPLAAARYERNLCEVGLEQAVGQLQQAVKFDFGRGFQKVVFGQKFPTVYFIVNFERRTISLTHEVNPGMQ